MLRTRVVTGCILGALLLLGLFLLPPLMGRAGIRRRVHHRCMGVGRVRRLAQRAGPRVSTPWSSHAVLVLGWRWTADPAHLIILLSAACVWWLIAFFVADARADPATARAGAALRPGRVGAGFPGAGEDADSAAGESQRSADRAMAGADGVRGGYRRLFRRAQFRAAKIGAAQSVRAKPGRVPSAGWPWSRLVAWGGAVYFGLPPLSVDCIRLRRGNIFHHRRSDREHVQTRCGAQRQRHIAAGAWRVCWIASTV